MIQLSTLVTDKTAAATYRSTAEKILMSLSSGNYLAESSSNQRGILLHGVTGSGKTAVYLAAMRTVLEQGRSAILLVPEIGLTPTVASDLHQVFGDEVAILHSARISSECSTRRFS